MELLQLGTSDSSLALTTLPQLPGKMRKIAAKLSEIPWRLTFYPNTVLVLTLVVQCVSVVDTLLEPYSALGETRLSETGTSTAVRFVPSATQGIAIQSATSQLSKEIELTVRNLTTRRESQAPLPPPGMELSG